jgi:hypothetical protein
MAPPNIQLQELYQLKKKKDNIKKKSYDRIIELIHRRIRNIASHGGENTFYEIPGILIGYPLYNITDCLNYVVEHLRKNCFLIQILPPPSVCVIYISWNPDDLKIKNSQKTLPYNSQENPSASSNFQMPMRPVNTNTNSPITPSVRKKLQFTF